ncbi:MAG: sensor histidine kinase [Solirubrobacterales bacterium]|nr:sensor histidine kinase [Solirubrobacterales bacterium]
MAICLRSPLRMAIFWGPELTCIFNDAERDALADHHSDALGMPARELLGDLWDAVGPHLQAVIDRGVARRGHAELAQLTYSCSPILDDDGAVGGVLLVSQATIAEGPAEAAFDSGGRPFHQSSRARLEAATARGRVQERGRHEHELRALLSDLRAAQRRVAAAGDAERRRIERDLHDGAQQRLMAIRLELAMARELLDRDPETAATRLEALQHELDETLDELRELAHGLYPALLASDGLSAALQSTARHCAIPVRVQEPDIGRAPRSIENAAYFCCLEALQNATKHAGPRACASIRVTMRDGLLEFCVSDDGDGFDPAAVRPGYGIVNVRDRVEALGGKVEVTSAPGCGTTVVGRIPLP